MYASTIAFQWILTTVTAWRCYARGWQPNQLGLLLNRPLLAISVGVALASALGLLQLVSLRQLAKAPEESSSFMHQLAGKMMPQTLAEALPFVALVCTVSLCEEFLYRGFAFSIFESLWHGSVTVGIFGSAALFGIGHLYQGRRGVVTTAVLGLILAGARAYTGSLAPPILAHLIVDLMAGLAGPRLLLRKAEGAAVSRWE